MDPVTGGTSHACAAGKSGPLPKPRCTPKAAINAITARMPSSNNLGRDPDMESPSALMRHHLAWLPALSKTLDTLSCRSAALDRNANDDVAVGGTQPLAPSPGCLQGSAPHPSGDFS